MSQANIPNISPTITITRDDAVNLLLTSIAMEELGLAHIINAEGEKLQYALGLLPGLTSPASLEDILLVNTSVQDTLELAIKKELLLDSKLKQVTQITSSGLNGATGVYLAAYNQINGSTLGGRSTGSGTVGNAFPINFRAQNLAGFTVGQSINTSDVSLLLSPYIAGLV